MFSILHQYSPGLSSILTCRVLKIRQILHQPRSIKHSVPLRLTSPITSISSLPPLSLVMTNDIDWSHSFCLACDRQTDGDVYCSEACRLAEYEAGSQPSSAASSPIYPHSSLSWSARRLKSPIPTRKREVQKLAGLAEFHSIPIASSPQSSSQQRAPLRLGHETLKRQSSSTQLSNSDFPLLISPTNDPGYSLVSEDSKRALRSYAHAFDQSRYNRRPSTP